MTKYLTFQLYGPLASWGEIAVGQVRHSANYPSKSALLGLLGAALGIGRDQELEQKNLAGSYRFFIKTLSTGSLLQDFHTAQTASSFKKRSYHSRREVLMMDEVKTILSTREYRCDSLAVVTVQTNRLDFYSLENIYQALLQPKYQLYLGRKSCPLALPLNPHLHEASGPGSALDQYVTILKDKLNQLNQSVKYLQLLTSGMEDHGAYYWEGEANDLKKEFTLTRYDQSINRRRWQFAPRQENQQMSMEI